MSELFDIAVVGSGFAGSLLAMIAKRIGRSVILLDRARHPRFAIGESSTPLANLLLEDLARRYDLPRLVPLSKYGSWQSAYPHVGCGLKRGFTFYHHQLGERFRAEPDRSNQLLVAASPYDRVADTHWYRPDFDAFLVDEARNVGVQFLDEIALDSAKWDEDHAILGGTRNGAPTFVRARWVVDASGPRGFLYRTLGLAEQTFPSMPATQSLYGHFTGVKRLDDEAIRATGAPYPPEDAAVHHVFDGGWVWVLRFNNGITSAGVAATDQMAGRLHLSEGRRAWERLLKLIPTLGKLFHSAEPLQPLTHVPRLAFRAANIHGPWWTMLPSAAGFVDPLLSTGFPLTLLGIRRLARAVEQDWGSEAFADSIATYARQTDLELTATARLIGTLYHCLRQFRTFKSLCMLYFAAVSFSEAKQRLNHDSPADAFLLHDRPGFGSALKRLCERVIDAGGLSSDEERQFAEEVRRAVEPINIAGLCDPARHSWYPADPNDLIEGAAKLGTSPQAVAQMLHRCGMAAVGISAG